MNYMGVTYQQKHAPNTNSGAMYMYKQVSINTSDSACYLFIIDYHHLSIVVKPTFIILT